jgi:transposase
MSLSSFTPDARMFKVYNQNQKMLLPPSLSELVPEGHLARIVSNLVDQVADEAFTGSYKGGGTTSYHPKMLAKVLVYAYLCRVYSGRQIARLLKENVIFMWLAGLNNPDFRSINRFRSERFGDGLKRIFREVLDYCQGLGLVQYENYFVDGTKLEADANRHKMVWRKNTERYKARVEEELSRLLSHIDTVVADENDASESIERQEQAARDAATSATAEVNLRKSAKKLECAILGKEEAKSVKKAVKEATKLIERQRNYERQQQQLGPGRNSYNKTDPDATAMRMKDDALRPAYNAMVGSENQIIIGYDLHAKAGDSNCFTEHMDHMKAQSGHTPQRVVGDAAFGSEENYTYLQGQKIGAYLKYNTFHKELKKTYRQAFRFDELTDTYICPQSKTLKFEGTRKAKSHNGFVQDLRIYSSRACFYCKKKCTTAKQRHVQRNTKLEVFKAKARQLLTSPLGVELRKKRGVEIESIFGDIKRNMKFRRFHLRGKQKCEIELGLVCVGHNLKKIHSHLAGSKA